jgi:galactokinase/mevalonate kinase-like predicted kinase
MGKRQHARRGETPELAELRKISAQLDGVENSMDAILQAATKSGAIAGAAAGAVSGGIISAGILLIRAKLGF